MFSVGRHIPYKAGAAALLLSLSGAAYGTTQGLPSFYDFQSQALINISSSTARVSTGQGSQRGITLAPASGVHKGSYSFQDVAHPVYQQFSALGSATIHDIALQDVDGDAVADVIIGSSDALFVLYTDLASGAISFRAAKVSTGSHDTLVFLDLDRDGNKDIVARKKVKQHYLPFFYKNDGDGGFEQGFQMSGQASNDLVIIHVDDGDSPDLVSAAFDGVLLFKISSRGEVDRRGSFSANGADKVIASGDFDGDDRADLVLGGGAKLRVFRNTGNWTFEEVYSHDASVSSISLGDVNNDGRLDIVAGTDGARNTLYLNNGSDRSYFDTGIEINGSGNSTVDVQLADMDSDGDLDLIEGNNAGTSIIYSNERGTYKTTGYNFLGGAAHAVALGDLDDDMDIDAVLGLATNTRKVCLNGGISTTAASTTLFDTGHGWVESSKVNMGSVVPALIHLTTTEVKPANTDVTYYLSNDGGGRWYQVRPGGSFRFPRSGGDLRWATRLTSLSPTTSPVIKNVRLEGGLQVYINGKAYKSSGTYDAGDVVARKPSTATLKLWNRGEKALSVDFTLRPDNEGFSLPGVGSDAGTSPTIAAGAEYETPLVFKPAEHGSRAHEADLTIRGSERGASIPDWTVSLTGFGVGPKILIEDREVSATRVNRTSVFHVWVRNLGNQTLNITGVETDPSDQFWFSPMDSSWRTNMFTIMSPRHSYRFQFRPKRRGVATATLAFASNAYNTEGNEVRLEGRGVAPVLRVFPGGAYSFGRVRSGSSATRTMEIGNHGDAVLEIKSLTVGSGLFSIQEAGGGSSAPHHIGEMSSASFVLSFAPRASFREDARTELTIISDDPLPARTTYTIVLRGEAFAPKMRFELAVCPAVKADGGICKFGDVEVGQETSTTLTITNAGRGEALEISSVVVAGDDFTVHGPSSATIEVGGSSTWQVHFSPSGYGPTPNGIMLTINNNDPENENGKPKVALEGRGIGADLAVSIDGVTLQDAGRYSFEDQSVGDSTSVLVVVSNTDADADEIALQVSGVALASTSSFAWSSSATFTVGPEASTTLHVSFRPPRRGVHETTLTITSNHLGGKPYQVRLAGTGTAPALVLTGFAGCRYATMTRTCDFGGVLAGGTSSVKVIVGNVGEEALRVTPTVSGGVYRLAGPADRLLDSGSTGTWTLHFSPPVAATSYAGALVFESNDPALSSRTVHLDGHGVGPKMVIRYWGCSDEDNMPGYDGKEYHYCYLDDVTVGTTRTVRVEIDNEGNQALVISSISVNQRYGRDYHLDGPATATIPVGVPDRWDVSCIPKFRFRGSRNAELSIMSNDRAMFPQQVLICGVVWSDMEVSVDGRSYSSDVGAYDFGKVEKGTSLTVPVVVTNTGTGRALVVRSLETSGTGFSVVGGGGGATIAAGASHTWRLRFSPKDTTTHAGELTVRSDDRERGEWRLSLEGRGVEAIPIIFGPPFNARVGRTDRQIVTIGNIGTAPLRIQSIVVTPGDFVPAVSAPNEDVERWLNERRGMAYTVTSDTRDTRELEPGDSTPLTVAFSPRVPSAEDNAVLTIHSNAPKHTVRLRGKGRGPLLLASIGADDNRRYVLSKATTHNVGTIVASDGVMVSTNVKVHLKNIGNEDLWVAADLTTGSGVFRLSTDVYPKYLITQNDPEPKSITVEFRPTDPGAYTETLTLTTSGSAVATHTIRLHGSRRLPLMEVGFGGGCRSTTRARTCDLGLVNVTTAQMGTLIVTNNSAERLLVTSALADADDAYSLVSSATQSIAAGSTATWDVRFTPRVVATTYAATLTFTGDHPDATARVNLTGVGAGPIPDVTYSGCTETSSFCDLPDVPYGTTATVRVTVENDGNADLVVRALDVPSRYDRNSPYTIEGSFPTTITSGSSHTWDVHLRAVEQQHRVRFAHRKELQIISNYHGAPPTKTLRALIIWPEIEVQVNGKIYASGNTYDFGKVWAGTETATLTIRNTGHFRDLVLDSIQVTGAGFSLNDTGTATIAAATTITRELRLSLNPRENTTSEGTLTMVSNDPDPRRNPYTLTLQGEFPDVRPDFGGATIATQTYVIHRRITSLILPTASSGNGTLGYGLTGPGNAETLPPGLSFDRGTRTLSGTPTAAFTTATYTWTATDEDGDGATLTFPITVLDYDSDEDGLIEIKNLAQLNAMRWDLDGDGRNPTNVAGYAAAFPGASSGISCRRSSATTDACRGYELVTALNFNTGDASTRTDDLYYNNGAGWNPIGSDSTNSYFGVFQGNGHTLSNLFIARSRQSKVGLFGHLTGRIAGVGLLDVAVSAYGYVGGLVGRNHGTISTSYISGSVAGTGHSAGGLVGVNREGRIIGSHSMAMVNGASQIGGLVGYNWGGRIIASYSTGTVSGRERAGGLVGSNSGWITASYATGEVSGHRQTGGLAGTNGGMIVASYATGRVSGHEDTGGLAGNNGDGTIVASYSMGKVTGSSYTGGLVGLKYPRFRPFGIYRYPGYIGSVYNSYWDTRTSGQSGSDGGMGQKTFELRAPTTYTGIYAAWNVDADGVAGGDDPWDFGTSTQYPVLRYGFSSTSVASQKAGQPTISTDASLRELRVTAGASVATLPNLLRGFEGGVTSYTVPVDVDAERVTVSATASHSRATVALSTADAATATAGRQVALTIGGDTAIMVSVTAQDGSVTTYVVTVRQPDSLPSFGATTIARQIYVVGGPVHKTLPAADEGNGTLGYALTGPGSTATLTLPPGLSLDRGTRTLSGTPTAAFTTATYTWKATDRDGDVAALTFPITVFDYDSDQDGLIEIKNLMQLNAMRWDLDGDGRNPTNVAGYAAAFPGATSGISCRRSSASSGVCKGYELAADLDFNTGTTGTRTDDLYYNGGKGWEPIAPCSGTYLYSCSSSDPMYAATFDGNGHSISNVYIRRRNHDYIGLFGRLADSSNVTRVKLLNVDAEGRIHVGGVAGRNRGSINASCVTGAVKGRLYQPFPSNVGGLVGWNSGKITASCATGTVSEGETVGGLVGSNSGEITASYATGAVDGSSHVGGLIGRDTGEITASYATGAVNGSSTVGGLVGWEHGKITVSYATGAVNGNSRLGGLTGENDGEIVASYAMGAVNGSWNIGGLVGENNGEIVASYATGAVNGSRNTGGLVGSSRSLNGYGAVTINSYWDTRASSQTESAGGTGKKTFELRSPTAYTGIYAAWNVDLDGVVGADNPWDFGTRAQYPILRYGHSTTSLALQQAVQPAISADSRLSALSIRNAMPGAGAALPLSPSFDAGTTSYFATAGSSTGRVTIAATAASTGATVAYAPPDADTAIGHQVLLNSDRDTVSTVRVTAQDGSATAYVIVVGRMDLHPSFGVATIARQIYVAGEQSVRKMLPEARGGNGALRYALTGPGSAATLALPLGLSLDAGTRTLSGVAATAFTTATYTWTAADSDGDATTLTFTIAVTGSRDYDSNNNGLIEIRSLSQLHAIRWDLNGDGTPDGAADYPSYAPAFPRAMAGMGCPTTGVVVGCKGYELMTALNFNTGYRTRTDDLYYNGGAGWEPVGGISNRYAAIFDGNGHGISNLYIKRRSRDYIGLFGYLDDSSSITQVKLLSVNVEGNYNVGGVAGRNKGSISASCAQGVVRGYYYVGGFVGRNSGTISASCAKGTVRATGWSTGGFVGINRPGGKIYANYATGAVNGRFETGGLIGDNSGEIVASYATGAVDGESYKGGLVGGNQGKIAASYATGAVSGWSWWRSWAGGLVGGAFDSGTVTNSYWNTDTSGQSTSRGGVGKSTSELRAPTAYTGIYAAWNVNLDGVAGGDNPWDFGTSTQYPVLRYGGHDVSRQRPPTETAARE